jgi:hypothetical protein
MTGPVTAGPAATAGKKKSEDDSSISAGRCLWFTASAAVSTLLRTCCSISTADKPRTRMCRISSRVNRPLGTGSAARRRSSACCTLEAAMMTGEPLGGSMRESVEPGMIERPVAVARSGSSQQASTITSEKRARWFSSSVSRSSEVPLRSMTRTSTTRMSTGSRCGPRLGGCEPWPEKKTTSSPLRMRPRKVPMASSTPSRVASSTKVTAKPAASGSRPTAWASLRALRSLGACR